MEMTQTMRRIQWIGLAMFGGLLLSCSGESDCFVADVVEPVEQVTVGGTVHHIYLRTSGFNEKEQFFELYAEKPVFDDCGQAETTPVATVHIDENRGHPERLTVGDLVLEIDYSSESGSNGALTAIAVQVE